ncbi:LYS-like protein [Mya arenaria]|uniref:lysozyme n=1 Tax=Mya arenaria TaxID=6604 RepID=A0ABY7E9C7_MYAAR|nr:LYS-like protein [Mya arenaria]WAR06622.1 LYS-like protein [Mya arenaria]
MVGFLWLACVVAMATEAAALNFTDGIVSHACLECICKRASGCQNDPCKMDLGSLSCGYFQIKEAYYQDCPWEQCSADVQCASQCVQNYMARYVSHTNCSDTCETYAREHNGGPKGCAQASTLGYWHEVQHETGCQNVP